MLKAGRASSCHQTIARGGVLSLFLVCLLFMNVSAAGEVLQKAPARRTSQGHGSSAGNTKQTLGEAAALLRSGQLEEAEAATRKIVAANSRNAEAHSLLGVILDQRGLTAEAEREYHAALILKPKSVAVLSNLGVLLARTNRASEAILKFEAALRVDPQHETAVYNLGALYAARGDYKRAIPLLEKATGITPRKPEAQQAADAPLRLTLLNAYMHADRRKEALESHVALSRLPAVNQRRFLHWL